jgi:hypothetical protein
MKDLSLIAILNRLCSGDGDNFDGYSPQCSLAEWLTGIRCMQKRRYKRKFSMDKSNEAELLNFHPLQCDICSRLAVFPFLPVNAGSRDTSQERYPVYF